MEINKPVKDPYRSALKKKGMAYMPKNYEDINSQKGILAMIVAVLPTAAGIAKSAENALWPKVQAGKLPILQAVGQCALEINKIIAVTPAESMMLEKRGSEQLLKAWVALEYYSYLMLPEYSGNIRALRDRIFAILRQRDTGAAPAAQPKAAPAAPVTAVPVERTGGQPQIPKPKVPMPQPPVQPPVALAEDFGKTVMAERPNAGAAQELGKTVMVENAPEQAEELDKTAYTSVQENNMFAGGEAEEIGATVNVAREDIPAGKKSGKSGAKLPIIIIAAVVVIAALVAGILISGSKSVEKTEAAIEAIGTVTMESGDAIAEAEELYDGLSKGNREKVENRDTLFAAREAFDRMYGAVTEVQEAITAIKQPVSLDSGDAIAKARKLYDALAEDLKDKVSNYPALSDAESAYHILYTEDQAGKLYNAAKSAYDSGDHKTALAKIDDMLSNHPGSSLESKAKTLASSCVEVTAQTAMDENRLEDAMILLERAKKSYAKSDKINDLHDRLVNKLQGQRPANGKMFAVRMEQGYCKMVITAKGSDLCIKLTSKSDSSKYTIYYIREGETFSMHVKDGEYSLKYAYGDYWYGQEEMFGQEGYYYELDDTFDLQTIYSGNKVTYEYYEFTLDVNGGWSQKSVSRESF